ncbi:MAG TPA: PAS domain S-box protein [Phycisphaerae bacterium]|nr:PAS domain S-box protein [Phycisphaerae bacterium]HRY69598.1 PAS domain S-box protein [Phycisphaerae bacterium]HSA27287.1 PAS domain S-box protein [Phycisphaerae bacterium]
MNGTRSGVTVENPVAPRTLLAEEELKRNLRRQVRLNRLLQDELPVHHQLEQKLQSITDAVVEAFDADFCRIWVTAPGDRCESGCVHAQVIEGPHVCCHRDRCLHLLASSGRYTHLDGAVHRRVPFGCYKIGRVAAGQDSKFITNDAQNDPRVHNSEWAKRLGLVSFAGYRLTASNGVPVGVLALFAKHAITSEDDRALEGLAASSSHVIQATRAENALRKVLDELEDRVHKRTEELGRANRELSAEIAERKRTEQALRLSEEKYAKAFLLSPCGISLSRLDTGVFIEVNEATSRMLGYSREELIGHSSLDLGIYVRPDERSEFLRLLAQARTVRNREVPLRPKTGEPKWASLSAEVIEVQGRACLLTAWDDITERRANATRIETMHRELQDLSRQAGMAEIASGVLHNVGNVLDNVKVSAEVVAERIRRSRLGGLSEVSRLMLEHAADLGAFITEDARGRQLPSYLSQLAECLASEQETIAEELKILTSNIEHIKNIVNMQQAYATASSVVEPVMVEKLVDDALRINAMRARIEDLENELVARSPGS